MDPCGLTRFTNTFCKSGIKNRPRGIWNKRKGQINKIKCTPGWAISGHMLKIMKLSIQKPALVPPRSLSFPYHSHSLVIIPSSEPRGRNSANTCNKNVNRRIIDSMKIEFGKVSVLLNLGNRIVLKNNPSFSVYNSKTCSLQIFQMIQKNI